MTKARRGPSVRSKPRQIVVDGKPMIAVSAKEFESLLAMRRQLGSQTAKMRILRDALVDMTEFLDTLVEELVADTPEPPQVPPPSGLPHPRLALGHAPGRHPGRAAPAAGGGETARPRRGDKSPAGRRPGDAARGGRRTRRRSELPGSLLT
jgi:hypothetical protein